MLERKAISGVAWSFATYGLNKAVTLATTLVLARLLVPADFGVVALATLCIGFLALFSDLGLGSSLILRQDLDAHARGTILSLMLGLGALMGLATAALAPAAASVFGTPKLADVMLVLALGMPLNGYNWFREASLQRALAFRARFRTQTVQTAVYAVVAVATAALGAGMWSIVAGQLCGALAFAIALTAVRSGRVRPRWDFGVACQAVGASRGFVAQGGLAFLKQNADYLAIGRLLGASPLGLYTMAYRLAELPYWAVSDPVAKVTFPAFARIRQRGDDVTGAFISALQLVAFVACPLAVLLSAAAEPFTLVVLGERWAAMAEPLTVLALWGALRPIHATTGWLLNSVGRAGLLARVSASLLVVFIPSLFAAAALGGLTTVTLVMLAEMVIATGVLAALASAHAGVALSRQWAALRPLAVACPMAWIVVRLVSQASDGMAAAAGLALSVGAGAAAYAVIVWIMEPGLLGRIRGGLRRVREEADPVVAGP